MNIFENPENIKLLQSLLRDPDLPSSDSEDDDNEAAGNEPKNFGPGNIGPKNIAPSKKCNPGNSDDSERKPLLEKEEDPVDKESRNKITDIDQWLEQQEKDDELVLENRKRPDYTISYKQAVGTEDLFLQMGNKTAGSMSCEDMVIEIELPDETVAIEEMDLSVAEDEIDLQTPMYRLKLPLAHKIDPDHGKAKYDSARKVLIVTVRMNREFDFVNF